MKRQEWCKRSVSVLALLVGLLLAGGALAEQVRAKRMPAEKSPLGEWKGPRGDAGFLPHDAAARRVTKGKPVRFKNGYPDFGPYVHYLDKARKKKCEVKEPKLLGENESDARLADEALVKKFKKDLKDRAQVKRLREQLGHELTWHHNEDRCTMELVPAALHSNVPHEGGASKIRKQGGGCR
jgi:hypothetical protein